MVSFCSFRDFIKSMTFTPNPVDQCLVMSRTNRDNPVIESEVVSVAGHCPLSVNLMRLLSYLDHLGADPRAVCRLPLLLVAEGRARGSGGG